MDTNKNRKRLIYGVAKKICDLYMTYTSSCSFVDNRLVDPKVAKKFKELRDMIVEQSNSIKI